jgi:hypothetical protein
MTECRVHIQFKEDGQACRIQTSPPPQNQSVELPNATILNHSIRLDPSISLLAEQNNIGGISDSNQSRPAKMRIAW